MTSTLQSAQSQNHRSKRAWHIQKVQVIHFGLGTGARGREYEELLSECFREPYSGLRPSSCTPSPQGTRTLDRKRPCCPHPFLDQVPCTRNPKILSSKVFTCFLGPCVPLSQVQFLKGKEHHQYEHLGLRGGKELLFVRVWLKRACASRESTARMRTPAVGDTAGL